MAYALRAVYKSQVRQGFIAAPPSAEGEQAQTVLCAHSPKCNKMTVCRPVSAVETSCVFDGAVPARSARCRLLIEVPTLEPTPRTKHKQRGVDDLCARRLSTRDLVSISASIRGRRVSQLHSNEEDSKAQVISRSRSPGQRRTASTPVPRPKSRWSFRTSEPEPLERSRALRPNVRLYRLEIVQHPLTAAEFGSSTLTRLPLAPPLIAQLYIRDRSAPEDFDEADLPFLIAHLSLYSDDGTRAVDVIGPGGQTPSQQTLYGNLVSSPHILRNLQGRQGVYFLFPDVSIRCRGRYTLNVTLMKVDPTNALSGNLSTTLAQARSLPFDVCARNEYRAPGEPPVHAMQQCMDAE
ncbi:hypothetical protein EIP86_008387 [Pleurotus ostreatoroseus]|nr:hypothetical protein EIP86_008387 [Pleurotus ostreatoroseus]